MPAVSTVAELLAEVRRLGLVERAKRLEAFEQAEGSANDLAARLVAASLLTAFQADALLAGNGAGLVLKQYVLLDRVGAGGMGEVFRARHKVLGRIDAVKRIRAGRLTGPDAARRFRQEARLAARCSHPNLVTVYDADEADGQPFLAMEYVPGTDLHRLVRERGALDPGAACECVRQAALGLHHAHEQGLIHRDVKPANLLLAAGRVRVADLGLARAAEIDPDDGPATESGVTVGTPDFLAPEQCTSTRVADRRLDLYSLGCTLYFLITGRPPFPGGTATEKVLRHLSDRPTPVRDLCPGVPVPVAELLDVMLARDPENRPPTAEAVAERLAPFCTSAPVPLPESATDTGAYDPDTGWAPTFATPQSTDLRSTECVAQPAPQPPNGRDWEYLRVTGLVLLALSAIVALIVAFSGQRDRDTGPTTREPVNPQQPPPGDLPTPQDPTTWRQSFRHAFMLGNDDGYGVYAAAFSGDGRRLVVAVGSYSRPARKGAAHVFEFEPGGEIRATRLGETAATAGCVAIAPDGQTAAVGCGAWGKDVTGEVTLWNLGPKARLATFTPHTTGVHGLAFDASGQFLVTAGRDGAVRVWRLPIGANPKESIELVPTGRSPQTAVAVSPDRSRLAVGDVDGGIRLWDMNRWTVSEPTFAPAGRGLRALAFGPKGDHLAAAFDAPETQDSAVVWDARTGAVVRTLTPPDRAAGRAYVAVAFHPDGRTLVVMRRIVDRKGDVEFWDIPDGRRSGSLRTRTDPREIDLGLAAVGGAWVLWSLRPEMLVGYSTHWATGNCVAVDSSSGRLATGGDDVNLCIWVLPAR